MNYISNAIEIPDAIIKNSSISSNKQVFRLTQFCIILSFATMGFGDYFFGINVSTNVATLFIYLTLLIQILSKTLRLPKFLSIIYIFIIIQTFILNSNNISSTGSIKHFIGLVIFSLSLFSFVSVHRDRIINIVQTYYRLVIIIVSISIIQIIIFVFTGISIIPQNILSGHVITGSSSLVPEIFSVLPRAIGLSTEPAHYALIILPGVYIALLVLLNRSGNLGFKNKKTAFIILVGYILSFSLVAFLGLFLCFVSILAYERKSGFLIKSIFVSLFVGLVLVISLTPIGSKATSFIKLQNDISGHEYTGEDLSAFALVSNMMVAKEALKSSHFLGTGLNTHKDSYDKTIYKQFQISQVLMELNKEDAGSLFIRITSEFGIPGILSLIIFLIHYRLGRNFESSSIKTINAMCLVVLISYCARTGSYLSINFILFVALYYYSFRILKTENSLIIQT